MPSWTKFIATALLAGCLAAPATAQVGRPVTLDELLNPDSTISTDATDEATLDTTFNGTRIPTELNARIYLDTEQQSFADANNPPRVSAPGRGFNLAAATQAQRTQAAQAAQGQAQAATPQTVRLLPSQTDPTLLRVPDYAFPGSVPSTMDENTPEMRARGAFPMPGEPLAPSTTTNGERTTQPSR